MAHRDIHDATAGTVDPGAGAHNQPSHLALATRRVLSHLLEYASLAGLIAAGILLAALAARVLFGPSVMTAL